MNQEIRDLAEKYNDGRENDPNFVKMMEKLIAIRDKSKAKSKDNPAIQFEAVKLF